MNPSAAQKKNNNKKIIFLLVQKFRLLPFLILLSYLFPLKSHLKSNNVCSKGQHIWTFRCIQSS